MTSAAHQVCCGLSGDVKSWMKIVYQRLADLHDPGIEQKTSTRAAGAHEHIVDSSLSRAARVNDALTVCFL